MPGCAAFNCVNRTEKGYRMFRFPSPRTKRYEKWVNNVRRGGNWKPTPNSYICEKHFEDSQFEVHRQDGATKLKPNAVPTLFVDLKPPLIDDPLPVQNVLKLVWGDSDADDCEQC